MIEAVNRRRRSFWKKGGGIHDVLEAAAETRGSVVAGREVTVAIEWLV